jgi:hypothetical protein
LSDTNPRPVGAIAPAELIDAAMRRFPGFAISDALLNDVARLSGQPRWVEGTAEAGRRAIAAFHRAEIIRARRAGDARDLAAIAARCGGKPRG